MTMTLEEAIKILTAWEEPENEEDSDKLDKARQLLIEAGKRITTRREHFSLNIEPLLPGETEE